MRIDWIGGPGQAGGTRARRASQGFSLPGDPTDEAVAGTPAAQAGAIGQTRLHAAEALAGDTACADREAAGHGQAMLDALSDLQLAALDGQGGRALGRLAALAAEGRQATDPGLGEVLREVATRAAIELARSE